MIDVDATERICRIWWLWIAEFLAKYYDTSVIVMRTEKGYHLIVAKELEGRSTRISTLSGAKSEWERELTFIRQQYTALRGHIRIPIMRLPPDVRRKLAILWSRIETLESWIDRLSREIHNLTTGRVNTFNSILDIQDYYWFRSWGHRVFTFNSILDIQELADKIYSEAMSTFNSILDIHIYI